jgi:hypothetical protein
MHFHPPGDGVGDRVTLLEGPGVTILRLLDGTDQYISHQAFVRSNHHHSPKTWISLPCNELRERRPIAPAGTIALDERKALTLQMFNHMIYPDG